MDAWIPTSGVANRWAVRQDQHTTGRNDVGGKTPAETPAVGGNPNADFSDLVRQIMALPLAGSEKAEALRRLLGDGGG